MIHTTVDISGFSSTSAGDIVHFNKYLLKEMNKTQATSFLRRKDEVTEFQFWESTGSLCFLSQCVRDFSSWNLEQNQTFKLLFQCNKEVMVTLALQWKGVCTHCLVILFYEEDSIEMYWRERKERNEGVVETETPGSTNLGWYIAGELGLDEMGLLATDILWIIVK